MAIQVENINIATSGQVGKQFIYWVANGIQYKRPYVIPNDPKTFDQRTQRNKFYVAVEMWNELTTTEQNEWKEKVLKTQYTMTGYNLFLRTKIKEIEEMIKKVTHGSAILANGINVILISAIQLDKTVLHYNTFAFGEIGPPIRLEGILNAYFSDSTHITVLCAHSFSPAPLTLRYSIVEYV